MTNLVFRPRFVLKKLTTGTGKKIIIAFFVRGLGVIVGVIMGVVITRTLPVEEAGLFFLAFTIAAIFATALFILNILIQMFFGFFYSLTSCKLHPNERR